MIIIKSCAFRYVKFWKSAFPTLFKYSGDIAKTGDTSYLRCRFQSHTSISVVKASTWKLIFMIFMKNKCAWHLFCAVWQRGSRVMPLFEFCYIHIEKVCVFNSLMLPQCSSHSNTTSYTLSLYRVDVHVIQVWEPTQGARELCPFFNFLHNHIEKACVLSFLHSFQANPMKWSMDNSYEEEMSMTFFLWGQFQGFDKYAPFSKILVFHIENVCVSNSFLSFRVTPMKLAALDRYEELMFIQNLINSYKSKKFCFLFLFFTWCLHELWQLG